MTDFEQFEHFLSHQLTAEETTAFEERLKNDPDFAESFRHYQLLQQDMEQWYQATPGRQQLKQTLQGIVQQPAQKAKLRSVRWYLWRAAAVFIIAAAIWWMLLPASKSNEKLYAEYSAGETLSFTRGGIADSLWSQASGLLYDKKYNEAIVPLQQIINSSKDSLQEAALYLGYSYMQADKNESAENTFSSIHTSNTTTAEKLRWYKALLYLKTGKKPACINLLKEIVADGGAYSGKAKQLLKAAD